MSLRLILLAATAVVLQGCVQDSSALPQEAESTAAQQAGRPAHAVDLPIGSRSSAGPDKEEVAAIVSEGSRIIDTVPGDLTGDGGAGVLLVVEPEGETNAALGEGPARTVLLLTRDRFGRLQKDAENSLIVPCARCGGIAGDPYAYARIDAGTVTVSVSGGSRQRWFDDYIFRYSPQSSTWQLHRVTRGVNDTQTRAQAVVELSESDFGDIAFADFDPATLATVPALE